MKEKIYNAIYDPNVTFFLFPTPQLKQIIAAGEHEYVKGMVHEAKIALLEGKVLPVSKDDVMALLENRLTPAQHWLLTTGEVRLDKAVQVNVTELVNKGT